MHECAGEHFVVAVSAGDHDRYFTVRDGFVRDDPTATCPARQSSGRGMPPSLVEILHITPIVSRL
jgi:hypothetical protein